MLPVITQVTPVRHIRPKATDPLTVVTAATAAASAVTSGPCSSSSSSSSSSSDNPYKKVYLTAESLHTRPHRVDANNNVGGDFLDESSTEFGAASDEREKREEEEEEGAGFVGEEGREELLDELMSDEEDGQFSKEDYIYQEDEDEDRNGDVDEFFYEDYNENDDECADQDSYDKYSCLLDGM